MDSGYDNGFKSSTLINHKQKNHIGLIPKLMRLKQMVQIM
jgi:hypothetical protein